MSPCRKAVKATVILLPLLGVTYVLFITPPSDTAIARRSFVYINAVLQSTQVITKICFFCLEQDSTDVPSFCANCFLPHQNNSHTYICFCLSTFRVWQCLCCIAFSMEKFGPQSARGSIGGKTRGR